MMRNLIQRAQPGFSLIELSIATAIFSMGLGSLSMMMIAGIEGTAEARHQTVAVTQAESLAEMIAMNSDAFGHYVDPPGSQLPSCNEDFCRSEAMAAGNLLFWRDHLRSELPGSSGLVCRDSTPDDGNAADPLCDGTGALTVKIFWNEPRHGDSEDGGLRRAVSRLAW